MTNYDEDRENEIVDTRVSIWGVLLSPVWLALKIVILIGSLFGDILSGVLRWVANIAMFLNIFVWITCGFDMFLLVMIPIVFCWVFPWIWGAVFGILDGATVGIQALWHLPVTKREYDSYYREGKANVDHEFPIKKENRTLESMVSEETNEYGGQKGTNWTKENTDFINYMNSLPHASNVEDNNGRRINRTPED